MKVKVKVQKKLSADKSDLLTWWSTSSCSRTSAAGRSCTTVGSCTSVCTPPCTSCGIPAVCCHQTYKETFANIILQIKKITKSTQKSFSMSRIKVSWHLFIFAVLNRLLGALLLVDGLAVLLRGALALLRVPATTISLLFLFNFFVFVFVFLCLCL